MSVHLDRGIARFSRPRVSVSIADAPLLDLGRLLGEIKAAGAEAVHIDIEDGRFVPRIGLGLQVVSEVARWGELPLDVHLMVEEPEWVLEQLDTVSVRLAVVHAEATRYPRRLLALIHERGWRAGLAINPASALPDLELLLPYLDVVLALTTEPEARDVRFLEPMLGRLAGMSEAAHTAGVELWADGGVASDNVDKVLSAGVDAIVVGRALFSGASVSEAMSLLTAHTAR